MDNVKHPLPPCTECDIPPPPDVDIAEHPLLPKTEEDIPSLADVYLDEHPLPLNTEGDIPPPPDVDFVKYPLPPNTKGGNPPPADADTDEHHLPPNAEGDIPPPPDVDNVKHPLPPDTEGDIPPPPDMDIDDQPLPPNTEESIPPPDDADIDDQPLPPNIEESIPSPDDADIDEHLLPPNTEGGIPSPPDVEFVEHLISTITAENIPSPTDVTTGPAPVELLFLQESIYKDIVDNLSAKVAEKWVKECCNITPASTGSINKKLIIKEIEQALNGKKKLTVALLERLTQKMNDTAITTELYNLGVTAKKNARARKTQLLMHLSHCFTDEQNTNSVSKTLSKKTKRKSRQNKKMHKSTLNESIINKENINISNLNSQLNNTIGLTVTDNKENAKTVTQEPKSSSAKEKATKVPSPSLSANPSTNQKVDEEKSHKINTIMNSEEVAVSNQKSGKVKQKTAVFLTIKTMKYH